MAEPKQNAALPPPRGRVKAQIFQSLAGNLSSAASKAAEMFVNIKGGGSGGGSTSTSASTTPPPSAYASDGYPDRA